MDRGAFQELIAPYHRGITVDVGTGDGLFVYKCAQANPHTFFIGIDANRRPLQRISEKIHRRPAKGGLSNILFVEASVEDLPEELDGLANEVLVQFPWGSLLRGVAAGDEVVMRNLRRLCLPSSRLQVTIGIDAVRDRSEWERLKLPQLSTEYVETVLAARYREADFEINEIDECPSSDLAKFQTSWARRLQSSAQRSVIRIVARVRPDVTVQRDDACR